MTWTEACALVQVLHAAPLLLPAPESAGARALRFSGGEDTKSHSSGEDEARQEESPTRHCRFLVWGMSPSHCGEHTGGNADAASDSRALKGEGISDGVVVEGDGEQAGARICTRK